MLADGAKELSSPVPAVSRKPALIQVVDDPTEESKQREEWRKIVEQRIERCSENLLSCHYCRAFNQVIIFHYMHDIVYPSYPLVSLMCMQCLTVRRDASPRVNRGRKLKRCRIGLHLLPDISSFRC